MGFQTLTIQPLVYSTLNLGPFLWNVLHEVLSGFLCVRMEPSNFLQIQIFLYFPINFLLNYSLKDENDHPTNCDIAQKNTLDTAISPQGYSQTITAFFSDDYDEEVVKPTMSTSTPTSKSSSMRSEAMSRHSEAMSHYETISRSEAMSPFQGTVRQGTNLRSEAAGRPKALSRPKAMSPSEAMLRPKALPHSEAITLSEELAHSEDCSLQEGEEVARQFLREIYKIESR